jgi:hypothetical protein
MVLVDRDNLYYYSDFIQNYEVIENTKGKKSCRKLNIIIFRF